MNGCSRSRSMFQYVYVGNFVTYRRHTKCAGVDMRCLGEYPVPGIPQTADTFFRLSTSSSVPPPALSTSNSSTERMSYEVWVLTESGDSPWVLTGSGELGVDWVWRQSFGVDRVWRVGCWLGLETVPVCWLGLETVPGCWLGQETALGCWLGLETGLRVQISPSIHFIYNTTSLSWTGRFIYFCRSVVTCHSWLVRLHRYLWTVWRCIRGKK